MKDYLYDSNFLKQLDYNKNKKVNVRITALDLSDFPIEQISGVATGGSINIDGASAVRRSCSLTLSATAAAAQDLPIITDAYWCYNNKFKLEVGLNNNINSKYPDIIWFDMGIYLISSFSKSRSTNAYNVSISGKDKMARLNGEISGHIMAGTDFGTEEFIDRATGNVTITKLTIPTIIRNAVKVYGQERDENIIINDLDDTAFELWDYCGDKPMYLILSWEKGATIPQVINMTFSEPQWPEGTIVKYYSFNTLDNNYNNGATEIDFNGKKKCKVAKIEYGETAGYHQTPLVYNADLILNAGETVTNLLDKLKAMLGDFEYFYDLNGRFVFQKKNTYTQELFSPINGEVVEPTLLTTSYAYTFEDEELFTAISNSPKIDNIKNDFSVWGTRKGAGGADVPIHVRYALQKRPIEYTSAWTRYERVDGELILKQEAGRKYTVLEYEYPELIYQMAIDFYAHNQEADFLLKLAEVNPQFPEGKTGYEQYYIDMQGFWRQLYNPEATEEKDGYLYDSLLDITYYKDGEGQYWNTAIHSDPNSLNFWFNLFDSSGELNKYNIEKIGTRSKVVNESAIKSIYYRETPEVQFIVIPEDKDKYEQGSAYSPIWIQENMKQMFYRSAQGASAIDKVNDLIYQHTLINEAVTLTSIPIYYLQPNTRIYVKGQGDCTLDKISYNLTYNGTMSLTCNKIFKGGI